MKLWHLFFPFLFSAIGCSKTPDTPNSSNSLLSNTDFTITETDALGNPDGSYDPTSWKFDYNWTQSEENLFTTPQSLDTTSGNALVNIDGVAPNPCYSSIGFFISSNQIVTGEIVFVDKQLNIKAHNFITINAGHAVNEFSLSPTDFIAGQTYRAYYAFYNKDGVQYAKGHGNIMIHQ